jgi:hypothetical protein
MTRITGILHENHEDHVSDRVVGKNKTHFMFTNFFQKSYRSYTVELDGPWIIIWGMCIACWIPKATNKCSEYVILIALPLQ